MPFTPYTWNADRDGNRLRFGVKWQNYRATGGAWTKIDLAPRQVGGEWVFDRTPYALTIPALANGWATFESTNTYDIHSKRVMPDATVGVQKRYAGAVAVTGVPTADGLLFAGAFPAINAARLVQPHEQKVRDLIMFLAEPPGTGPVEVPVEIEFGSLPILESVGHGRTPRELPTPAQDAPVNQGLTFTTGSAFRGVRVKQPYAWDSAGRRTPIGLRGRVVGTRFVGKKVIPRAAFAGATYPVYADTTSTFYPDPNTETTSVDGYCSRFPAAESWAAIRGGDGTSSGASDAGVNMSHYADRDATGTLWDGLTRTLVLFDTSAIPDTDIISAATLSLKPDVIVDNGNQSSVITVGVTASNTALADSDFQSNTSGTTFASIDVTSLSVGTYTDYSLDAAGIANVSLTGISKFAAKLSGDAANSEPSLAANTVVTIRCHSADAAGTTSDPKLVVTYGVLGGPANVLLLGVG